MEYDQTTLHRIVVATAVAETGHVPPVYWLMVGLEFLPRGSFRGAWERGLGGGGVGLKVLGWVCCEVCLGSERETELGLGGFFWVVCVVGSWEGSFSIF